MMINPPETTGHSFTNLTQLTLRCRSLFLFCQVLSICIFGLEVAAMYTDRGRGGNPVFGSGLDRVFEGFHLTWAVFAIAAFVLAMRWTFTAHQNLRDLGVTGLTQTPIEVVAFHLFPVFALYKPIRAMDELWKASISPSLWKEQKEPGILNTWGGFWFFLAFTFDTILVMLFVRAAVYSDVAWGDTSAMGVVAVFITPALFWSWGKVMALVTKNQLASKAKLDHSGASPYPRGETENLR